MAERRSFLTFDGASAFARWVSRIRQEEVIVDAAGARFEVTYADPFTVAEILQNYVVRNHFAAHGSPSNLTLLLEVLSEEERALLTSPAVAWYDLDTGASWDAARLVCGDYRSDHPASPTIMNLMGYGGFVDWRLPTLDELTTITPMQWAALGIDLPGTQVWFDGPKAHWLDDDQFLRLHDMQVGLQEFREQRKDRQTHGDGYIESARTVFVRRDAG